MYQKKILLSNVNHVYDFHKKICKGSCNMDMVAINSKYAVDAKSLMGLLSMDLTKPVLLKAYTDDNTIMQEIHNAIKGVEVE